MPSDRRQPGAALTRSWFGPLGGAWSRSSAGEKRAVTLGEKLRQREHNQNGFDTIRLIAAALVLMSHSFPIVTGSNAGEPLYRLTGGQATLGGLSVGAFFFISGLLISNSFEASSTIASFARKRALRILPALFVACVLTILFLGPATTTLPLPIYFHGAWSFMKNAVFLPHDYTLPGVFQDHPMAAVNGSLWSLKFEVACYVAAALLLLLTRLRLQAVGMLWAGSFVVAAWLNSGAGHGGFLFNLGTAAGLFRYFGGGIVAYLLRDRLPLRAAAAWVAAALTLLATMTPLFNEAAATFGSYALLVFAYKCPLWFRKVTAKGDISYGTYVYAFPAQQLVLSLTAGSVWVVTAIALPATLLAALASWIMVEKPALGLKKWRLRKERSAEVPGFP